MRWLEDQLFGQTEDFMTEGTGGDAIAMTSVFPEETAIHCFSAQIGQVVMAAPALMVRRPEQVCFAQCYESLLVPIRIH